MVSKCANPTCSEKFLYLHQGKIFQLSPTPDVEAIGGGFLPSLYERFWLCDKCCTEMTLVWGGTEPKIVPLPVAQPPALEVDAKQKKTRGQDGTSTTKRKRQRRL